MKLPLPVRVQHSARLFLTSSPAVALALLAWTGHTLAFAQAPAPGYGQYPSQYSLAPQAGYGQQAPYSQPYPQQDQGYSYQGSPAGQPAQPAYDPPAQDYNNPPAGGADPYGDQGYAQGSPQAPLNVQQLEQLVAPIALYPDTLVAQVLAAATYPAQVVDADHWRQAQGYAPPDRIVYGADAQSWDPSVKGLTAFPQVLAELDQNLRWTTALGNAYYNQPQDVLDVVQVMRQRAQSAGNLQSSPQEAVTYDAGYIQLAPPDPQMVYLPSYDPWTAYGQPISPYPGFSLLGALGQVGSFLGSSLLRYGPGIAMTAFDHSPWGLLEWGLNWLSHSVLFHQSPFSSHSTTLADWGLPHGGARVFGRRNEISQRIAGNAYRHEENFGRGYSEPNSFTHMPGRRFEPSPERNPVRAATPNFNNRLSNRPAQNGYRGYQQPSPGYTRPPFQAWNRAQPLPARPQQPAGRAFTGRPDSDRGLGQGFAPQPGQTYGNRQGSNYGSPAQTHRVQQAYRAPSPVFQSHEAQNRDFGGRSYDSGRGRGFDGFSGKQPKQSGSHAFGGGREAKMQKMPKEKSFRPEHSHGGGFFGGHGGHPR